MNPVQWLREVVNSDGWMNILTGIGIKGRDKRLGAEAHWSKLSQVELESLYAGNDMAAKVVDTLPDDALREGLCFTKLSAADDEKLKEEMERLDVLSRVNEAWKWGRLYGGGAILIIPENPLEMANPMPPAGTRSIKAMLVVNRHELTVQGWVTDPSDPEYGLPESYMVQPNNTVGSARQWRVHRSWVVRFPGVRLPTTLALRTENWGDSVLTRLHNPLLNFDISHDAAATALQDFRVQIFKLNGLSNLVAGGKDDLIQKRLGLMNLTKSIARAIVIGEEDEFESKETTFTGVDAVLDRMTNRLAAAADNIPRTKLLGEGPKGGLGAAGRHEETNWYDFVHSQQEKYLTPKLDRLFTMLFLQTKGPFGGKPPAEFWYDYPKLWQMDDKEQVEVRKIQSEIDRTYVEMSVISNEEVRESRFAGKEYSIETRVEPGSPAPEPEVIEPEAAEESEEEVPAEE